MPNAVLEEAQKDSREAAIFRKDVSLENLELEHLQSRPELLCVLAGRAQESGGFAAAKIRARSFRKVMRILQLVYC